MPADRQRRPAPHGTSRRYPRLAGATAITLAVLMPLLPSVAYAQVPGAYLVGTEPRLAAASVAFGLIIVVATVVSGWRPLAYFIGDDNRVSNSKTQLALWSATVLGVYLTTVFLRLYISWTHGPDETMIGGVEIPSGLLAVSGMSALTFAGARAVTVSKLTPQAGEPAAAKPAAQRPAFSDLFRTDSGTVDLGDTQMILITLIAIGLFLLKSYVFWGNLAKVPSVSLPDLDTYLVASFGIGQGAYLAKKAASPPGKG